MPDDPAHAAALKASLLSLLHEEGLLKAFTPAVVASFPITTLIILAEELLSKFAPAGNTPTRRHCSNGCRNGSSSSAAWQCAPPPKVEQMPSFERLQQRFRIEKTKVNRDGLTIIKSLDAGTVSDSPIQHVLRLVARALQVRSLSLCRPLTTCAFCSLL